MGGGAGSPKVAEYLNQVQEIAAGLGSATAQHLRYAQVVLLGAGMDTRAQRLDFPPGTVWFEVDRTEVLRVKHNLLCSIKRKVLHNTSITVRSAGVYSSARPHAASEMCAISKFGLKRQWNSVPAGCSYPSVPTSIHSTLPESKHG